MHETYTQMQVCKNYSGTLTSSSLVLYINGVANSLDIMEHLAMDQ